MDYLLASIYVDAKLNAVLFNFDFHFEMSNEISLTKGKESRWSIYKSIIMQMIIQFPFECRYRTAFNNFFIQHIPLVNSPITKRILSIIQSQTCLFANFHK